NGYGIAGVIQNAAFAGAANGVPGAVEFNLEETLLENLLLGGGEITLSDAAGRYNGLVLTFTQGELRGTSVRVIGYSGSEPSSVTGFPYTFTVYPEQSRDVPANISDIDGDRVLLNGRAYMGWGAGGLSTSGGDAKLALTSLQPNLRGQTLATLQTYISTGVNESWDAIDHQNLFLGGWVDDNRNSVADGTDQNGLRDPNEFIASFDRYELFSGQGGITGGAQDFRAIGDPADTTVVGMPTVNDLQVDNDGDGEPDSVWMDVGYPVQTDINGRRYKPLVAYMVVDMDNRFNINGHGDLFDFDPDGDGVVNRAIQSSGVNLLGNVDPLAANLPHGQYLGPPEISMAPLLGTDTEYQELVFSRYGEDNLPGNGMLRDSWSRYQHFGHPDMFHPREIYPNQYVGGLFGTALDIHGRYGLGMPHFFSGVPVNLPTADADSTLIPQDEIRNSAYEYSLFPHSRYAAVPAEVSDDHPFSAQEIERLLRQYDRDAKMLPSRVEDLIGSVLSADDRHLLTAHSFETPAIPGLDPDITLGEAPGNPVPVTQRVYNLLIGNGMTSLRANETLSELLSYEIRMGLPFDLNRPFGDGRDNDGNGIYDELTEIDQNREFLDAVNGLEIKMDPDGDGGPNNSYLSRYNFAKQLYVLALVVTGDTNVFTPVLTPPGHPDTTRRRAMAQWAMNVVDFRDSDSIRTPFEFDFNPFDNDGWSADGNLTTPDPGTETIWGLERPELVLTESVAFHDRRSQDLTAGGGLFSDGDDDDYDSRLIPNASVFFEIYRPWTQDNTNHLNAAEMDLAGSGGVDLMQESAPGHPVWRLVVSTGANFMDANGIDVDDMPQSEQLRRIYFRRPDAVIEPEVMGSREKVYYPSATVQGYLGGIASMGPGSYALVGSSGTATGAIYDTHFGRRNGPTWDTELDRTRGITLYPDSDQVGLRAGSPDATETVYECIAIPIDASASPTAPTVEITRSLGVSDPTDGYYAYETLADVTPVADGYELLSSRGTPFDEDPVIHTDAIDLTAVTTNGPSFNFRSVYLQRLANPALPWDAVTNPYLTIDRQSIDLTAFNGAIAADASYPNTMDAPTQIFASNERGRTNNPDLSSVASSAVQLRRVLWKEEAQTEDGNVVAQSAIAGDTHHFNYEFFGSPGFVNLAYDHPDFYDVGLNPAPVGFAGLTWLNRPLANHYELLEVPYTTSFELLQRYTLARSFDPYIDPTTSPNPGDGRFGHLMNFYSAKSTAGIQQFPSGMGALLDFVRVPSRFAGTQRYLNDSGTLSPPFNILSRYREPGKININTMIADEVRIGWLGAAGAGVNADGEDLAGMATTYRLEEVDKTDFEGSRRSNSNGTSLSLFDNPFRNFVDFDKTPYDILVYESPALATYLRSEINGGTGGSAGPPLLEAVSTFPFADPLRDSQFRFQNFRRIGATTTTRSSVFAIWITVGRFEVDEDENLITIGAGDAVQGVELGADTGKAKRSRGFFMIDRSIPVGYEPGENHNIEKMILTETIIR
ncbi:MAG: hypothetical protein ACR2NP_06255, partial [Pirellulaceae bacterium]